jgi:hypothetical protein
MKAKKIKPVAEEFGTWHRQLNVSPTSASRSRLMSNTEVLIKLRDLHEELVVINDDLKTTDPVDEDTVDALGQLVTDVVALLDRTKEVPAAQPIDEKYELLDRVMKFKSDHPRVHRMLSQVSDVLLMIGL